MDGDGGGEGRVIISCWVFVIKPKKDPSTVPGRKQMLALSSFARR